MAERSSKVSSNSYMNDSQLSRSYKSATVAPIPKETGAYVSKGLAVVYLAFYFAALVTIGLLVSYFVPYKYNDIVINKVIPCDELRTTPRPTSPTTTTSTTTTSTTTTSEDAVTTTATGTPPTTTTRTTQDPIAQQCAALTLPGSLSLYYRPQQYSIYIYNVNLAKRTFTVTVDIRFTVLRQTNTIEMGFNGPFGLSELALGVYQVGDSRPIQLDRLLECYKVARSRNLIVTAKTSFQANTQYDFRIKFKSGCVEDVGENEFLSNYSSGLNEFGLYEKKFRFQDKMK